MKKKHKIGDWYKAEASNLVVHIHLQSITSLTEVWKWEIEFTNTDKTLSDATGWAHTLTGAKVAATECAELFAGKGNVGEYCKQSMMYPDDDVV